MIIFCDNLHDDHAPFPHRLVITTTPVLKREGKEIVITYPYKSQTFVICANCGHWIGRKGLPRTPVRCGCAYRCHNLLPNRYQSRG